MSVVVDRDLVWTVTLDRPERANALDVELVEALLAVLDDVSLARPAALVLRGNRRHFAAGFDLTGLDAETDATLALRFLRIGVLLERLADAPCATVAVVQGSAIGAGADLALACDHRLIDPHVTLRFPGAQFGVALGRRRRATLGGAWSTGDPSSLRLLLREIRLDDAPPRPPRQANAELADLARSVAVPGLRDRIAAYTDRTLTKEHT